MADQNSTTKIRELRRMIDEANHMASLMQTGSFGAQAADIWSNPIPRSKAFASPTR